ncbi:dimer_Tnp_hAT domain-containing protein [Trichonephila clavipes]|nr:dimer_Tnp_hAT domain-containing protein [Trichonephila clavipes]
MTHSSSKEELLGLLPLKGQTRGEDIANAVIECMDKHHIPLDKILSISTDGAKKGRSIPRTNGRSLDPKLLFHGRRYVSSKSA